MRYYALMDAEIPVLNPASIQDVLDYGIHGWEMSRFSGAWVGLTALADTMDSGSVVDVTLSRLSIQKPAFPFPEGGVHMRRGDIPLSKEARLRQIKLTDPNAMEGDGISLDQEVRLEAGVGPTD